MAIPTADLPPKSRKIGNLKMIWRIASNYPAQIAGAAISLLIAAAATLGVPYSF